MRRNLFGAKGTGGAARAMLSLSLAAAMALGSMPATAFAEALESVGGAEVTEQVATVEAESDEGLQFEETTPELVADDVIAEGQGADVAIEDAVVEDVASEGTDVAVEEAVEADAESEATDSDQLAEEVDGQDEADKNKAEGDADDAKLSAQAVSQRTLPLNGQWQTFTPTGTGTGNAVYYRFTLSSQSLVQLGFQNWWSATARWELWDGDLTTQYWSYDSSASYPGSNSDYCYLKAGTYAIKAWSYHSGSGYFRFKGTATPTSHPVRNNDTFDTAASMSANTTVKGLFCRGDSGDDYYKFTVSGTKKVSIICQESDANIDTVDGFRLYNASKTQVGGFHSVSRSCTSEYELSAGTYYVKVSRYKTAGGPYTIKYQVQSSNLADANVSLSKTSYTYNAKTKTPSVTVKLNGTTLSEGTDYTVSYASGRKNVGTYKVTVTGTGKYTGSKAKTFTIKKRSLSNATVSGLGTFYYTGSAVKPSPKVVVGGRTLVKGTDYTLSYKNNTKVGTAKVTIKGKGNYKGSVTKSFKIAKSTAKVNWGVTKNSSGQVQRIKATVSSNISGGIRYKSHVQSKSWTSWKANGALCGTAGKRSEAVQFELTGTLKSKYDVYYCVKVSRYGWMGWAKNGQKAGTTGLSQPITGLKVKLVAKGGSAPAALDYTSYRYVTKTGAW